MSLIACLAHESRGADLDALLGTFQLVENGTAHQVIKIEQRQQKYLLYRGHSGHWDTPVEVRPISKPELEAIIKQPVNVAFDALGNDKMALIKVPKGWKIGAFVCRSGYWLATVLGPAELRKASTSLE